jgi:hypothetical protein
MAYIVLLGGNPHRKKRFLIFPYPAGTSLTKLSLGGNNLFMTSLFPPRESLVSDIPARDGNIEKLFFTVQYQSKILFRDKGACKSIP